MNNNYIANYEDITGKGLVFPLQLNNGRAVISSGPELIISSVKNILGFEFGERFFLYEFGVLLRDALQDPNDEILASVMEYRLQTQVPQWDKRVKIINLTITRDSETSMQITLDLGVIGTNIKETFVFPYYKEIIY